VKLPDTEFFMNLGDWPLNEKNQKVLLPIVSWCGSSKANDIILPTYELTKSILEINLGYMLYLLNHSKIVK
jgi:hypothetical protein